ncbi:class I SAM-dependent methyltransferase [Streptomyces sp. NPDC057052]|uniref:class I SAM-dependent methyltransferase n=1 Tax=Streptomyces sp. NPDC057052 TaxID=3346010 RepID=UPI00363B38F9
MTTSRSGAARRIADLAETMTGGPLPVRLRTWDGAEAGPPGGPVVVVRSRRALRRLLWEPGELGLAQAYVTGDLDVEGDLGEGLRAVWAAARERELPLPRPSVADRARAVGTALRLGALGPRPGAPASRARLRGGPHGKARDKAVISHHHDLPEDFHRLLLDETMARSCGYWPAGDPECTPADAQRAKLELVCRKLALVPGARLLDIGCGWGALTLHASERHKAQVTAVTPVREQAAYVRGQVRERGLEHRVEVVCQDYRDIPGGAYDAVAAVETGERVGDAEYPAFAASLHRLVRPRGRVLVQQVSRGREAPGGGASVGACIAPDLHLRPLGETVVLLERAGLEVRSVESMREHYVRTVDGWHRRLEERWDDVVRLVGVEAARAWRLCLVGGALDFEEGRTGVDQILSTRPAPGGAADTPVTPGDWYTGLRER